MAIDATVGGASANSFATLAEAGAYFGSRLQSGAWNDASDGDKEHALLDATRRLSLLEYAGTQTNNTDQSLPFPRSLPVGGELWRRYGRYLPIDEIPDDIKNAQFETAIAMLELAAQESSTGGLGDLAPFESVQVGSIRLNLREGLVHQGVKAGRIADWTPLKVPVVAQILGPYLLAPPGNIALVRS